MRYVIGFIKIFVLMSLGGVWGLIKEMFYQLPGVRDFRRTSREIERR
ncbi:MAG: hypothetical protein Q4D07_05840 [Selenomonadaceae bacterium]|nr:hypothetical protein [Selenomonadaceae bacterium]